MAYTIILQTLCPAISLPQYVNRTRVVCGFNVRTGVDAKSYYAKYGRNSGVGSSIQDGIDVVAMIRKLVELGKWPLSTPNSRGEGFVSPSIFLTAGGENVVVYELTWARTSDRRAVTILADDIWLKEKISPTNTRWGRTVVFAHELGHIYLGHIYGRGASATWQQEYDADVFAGFMMYHLGAGLSASQSIFKVIAETMPTEDPNGHPSLPYRLEAVRKGWIEAGGREETDNPAQLGAGNVYISDASSYLFGITFEVEGKRYKLDHGNLLSVPLSGENAVLNLWECPPSGCRWSEFRIAVGKSYRIINSGYGQGLKLEY